MEKEFTQDNVLEEVETKVQEEVQAETQEYTFGENAEMPEATEEVVKEKVVLGFIGALLGSLIGVACIVLLGQLGYIASICGVVMGFCAIKGYRLLAGKLSVKGIVITIVLMVVMVYLSNWISYALAVAEVWEVDFFTAFINIHYLIGEGAIIASEYIKEVGMLYAFTALGLVPTVRDQLKK